MLVSPWCIKWLEFTFLFHLLFPRKFPAVFFAEKLSCEPLVFQILIHIHSRILPVGGNTWKLGMVLPLNSYVGHFRRKQDGVLSGSHIVLNFCTIIQKNGVKMHGSKVLRYSVRIKPRQVEFLTRDTLEEVWNSFFLLQACHALQLYTFDKSVSLLLE